MTILGTTQRPLRVAIVGAGPAGFYVAETLFKQDLNVKIDMFEKLPAPFGLVRYGVAPDHEKIKNVIKIYEKIASDSRFSFFGNVAVGQSIGVVELKKFYDATVFCYGTEADRRLGIKGEGLKGSHLATEFVGWYNGHPQFRDCCFDFSHEVTVIMGQGNVAMDVARILCSTAEELSKTDISQHALDELAKSRVKEVHVYGRRGPVQAAFTPLEIREMGGLKDAYPVVDQKDLQLNEASSAETHGVVNSFRKKNIEILQSFTVLKHQNRQRKFVLHFLRTPVEIIGKDRVEKVKFEINELTGDAGQQKVKGTGQFEEIECGLFFTSIGYEGVPMQGVPFSPEKGIIPNRLGRVLDGGTAKDGWYVSGWIGHGASGVIGTNKIRAEETVRSLVEDLEDLPACETPSTEAVVKFLRERSIDPITFIDWKKIDAYEIMLGLKAGKPREKITEVSQMLSVAKEPSY